MTVVAATLLQCIVTVLQRHGSFLLVLALLLGLSARPSPVAAQGDRGGGGGSRRRRVVDVGVILDRKTWVGNISWPCMELAMEDFYGNASHAGYGTRLKLHLRDTGPDAVDAASAGVDLLKNVGVQAIVGPQTSTQAKFLAELGHKSSVPVISFSANSPSGYRQTPNFIRTAWNDSSQAEAIAALVQRYNWSEVVPVFEDDDSNTRFIPDLVDALRQVDARVSYRCKIHPSAKEDEIKRAISSLKYNWTSVFVVRMSYPLARKFFQLAKDEGMMAQGFVWVIAYGLTDIFDVLGSPALDVMQGVLGVKPHVQDTVELKTFRQRWHEKYLLEYPGTTLSEPTVSCLYAYDTIWALALAAEKTGYVNSDFGPYVTINRSTDFDRIGTSKAAQKLRGTLLTINFLGMSGEFHIQDMQLLSVNYEIINIVDQKRRVIGFWTPGFGISGSLNMKADLDTIIWPGGTKTRPRGWLFPMNKTLKIGVPVKGALDVFVRFENGTAKGFCIDLFEEVVRALPYDVPHSYEQFVDGKGDSKGSYDELVQNVYLKKYDAVVGDITILADRSSYVDFTVPYTESGVRMLVPVRDRRQKTAWTFLKPLTADLWLGTVAFVVFTGFAVWFIEGGTNEEFNSKIGPVLFFAFSTLVFAHKESIKNNLSRIIVFIWLFVVLILQQSYTATLSSILTVEQLQPTVTNLDEVIRTGSYVGYLDDSFLPGLLKSLKIDQSKMIAFNSPAEYNEALSTGKVAVIIDEIPYLKVFLSHYCHNYTMIGPTYKFDGFGYAFPRGSPLTSDISREILNFSSNAKMAKMEKQLYGDTSCPDKDDSQTSSSLTLHSFQGLLTITGASSMLAIILHVIHQHDLSSQSSWRGCLALLSKLFHVGDSPSNTPNKDDPTVANDDRNHIIDNLGSHADTGSPPEGEGMPAQDPEPLSSYMHSEREHNGVPSLSRNASTIRYLGSHADTGSSPEGEGMPAQDPEPLSSYMRSEREHNGVASLSRNASTVRWRQRSLEKKA